MLRAAPPPPSSPHRYLSFLLFKASAILLSTPVTLSPLPLPLFHLLPSFSNLQSPALSHFFSSSLRAGLTCQVVFNPPPVHTSFLSLSFEAVYLFFAPSQNNSSLLTSIRPASFPFLFSASLFFHAFLPGRKKGEPCTKAFIKYAKTVSHVKLCALTTHSRKYNFTT